MDRNLLDDDFSKTKILDDQTKNRNRWEEYVIKKIENAKNSSLHLACHGKCVAVLDAGQHVTEEFLSKLKSELNIIHVSMDPYDCSIKLIWE